MDDLRWVGKIRKAAGARFRDDRLDVSDCGAKVRKLIEDAVIAEGIQILVQRVSIFSKDFDAKLAALKSDEARASEMEHALRDEIQVRLAENPAFYTSLRERRERIIADVKAKRINAAKQLELEEAIRRAIREQEQTAEQLGLTPTGLAIYGILEEQASLEAAEPREPRYNEASKELASLLEEALAPHTRIVDWTQKEDVQREMRNQIKRRLTAARMPEEQTKVLVKSILELVKVRQGR